MNYAELMAAPLPCLAVKFGWVDSAENFSWGVQGNIPSLSLIGGICEVQENIVRGEWIPEANDIALVLAYDAGAREFHTFLSPEIPKVPLVGMLEMIKQLLVSAEMAKATQQVQGQRPMLLGPDGRPVRM